MISVSLAVLEQYVNSKRARNSLQLEPSKLQWTPYSQRHPASSVRWPLAWQAGSVAGWQLGLR